MGIGSTVHASPGIYEIQDFPIIPWLVMRVEILVICVCFLALRKDREDASRLMPAVGPAIVWLVVETRWPTERLSAWCLKVSGVSLGTHSAPFLWPGREPTTNFDSLSTSCRDPFRKTGCRGTIRPAAVIAGTYRSYYIAIVG